jgi:ADP-ribose pyrophosphatase YjhB (NUDIX family)
MITTQQIVIWADKLRDISALGLLFSKSQYDIERYQAMQDLAILMLASAVNEPVENLEPLRATLFTRPTPLATGDAAIIDKDGQILLIQRADNHKWAMPGGALEVGEMPSEGVVREALEETGCKCEPVALVGVFDSRYCGTVSRHHLYQFVFLCKPVNDHLLEKASHAHEVVNVQWFARDSLPQELDPGHIMRIPFAFECWEGNRAAYFDKSI